MKDYCFTKIPNEIIWVPELTSSEFRVYATLRSFSPCFAGYGSLKKMMGLSLATISNAINSLERKGLIRVDRGGLNRGPNQYHILSRQEWTQPALISKRNQLQKLKSNKTNINKTVSLAPVEGVPIYKEAAQRVIKNNKFIQNFNQITNNEE